MHCKEILLAGNIRVASGVHALRLPFEGEVKPGQFFMLKPRFTSVLLPRAISACDYQDGMLDLLVQSAGAGTCALCSLRAGDALTVTGPLGNGFPLQDLKGKIALVGGGIGIAPLLYTARSLQGHAGGVDACLGYRSETYLTGEFSELCSKVLVATEDGSTGHKGYVTGILKPEEYGAVLCCGPQPMMKAVTQLCEAAGIPAYVSLEEKMACGVGGCFVCTCTGKDGKNRRTCLDGPVFRGEEVDFDA